MDRKAKHPQTGKWYTREEWESKHKPTCNKYPCEAWSTTHWHFNRCSHQVIRAIRLCDYCDKGEIKWKKLKHTQMA